jgi:Flp pilus assembly protein TadD
MATSGHHNLGMILFGAGRFMEAEEELRKALENAPGRIGSRMFLTMTLLGQGRSTEARAVAMGLPEGEDRLWSLAIVHDALGERVESDEALRQLIEGYADNMAIQIAQAYAARGEAGAAFEWLERAYSQRDPGVTQVRMNHFLRSLQADPRWDAFLKKMGFEV